MKEYEPLTSFLKNQLSSIVELAFEDVEDEEISGVPLPVEAYEDACWWHENTVLNVALQNVGWRIDSVDVERERVVLSRIESR